MFQTIGMKKMSKRFAQGCLEFYIRKLSQHEKTALLLFKAGEKLLQMCKISSFTPTLHFLKLNFTHNFTLVFKVRLKSIKLLSQLYV